MGRLDGKVALISGGAGGAGRESSILFAREGAKVAILDRQAEAGRLLTEELNSQGHEAIFFPADVSQASEVANGVKQSEAELGPITVLVNHAGTFIAKPFLKTTEEEWDWLMAVNVKGMYFTIREVLPSMLAAGGGSIVNTSSVSGVTASSMESVYCVSKGAILQLSRAICVEFRERGIRCNSVCPGFMKTDHGTREMQELIALGVDLSDEAVETAQVRLLEPLELAKASLFLASDESSFVNGASLMVDNGWTVLT